MEDPPIPVQSEEDTQQTDIVTSLQVDRLDANLFRSKDLKTPFLARGVFGGQVISQALVSATQCVQPEYLLHSLHCYFLLSASASIPILYYVDNLRNGRSYVTRSVRAVQNGRAVFVLLCSFQIPEPSQPMQQWPMPSALSPERSIPEEDFIRSLMQKPGISEAKKAWYLGHIEQRESSPVEVRLPLVHIEATGKPEIKYWMKTRERCDYGPSFQKSILAYISDLHFLNAATLSVGLRRKAGASTMVSTLDHSISYYSHDFNCSEWMLYVIESPAVGSGRGYVRGRMYSREGELLAVMTQEGVMRAHRDVRPVASVAEDSTKAKL
ncbi:thioesterase-like superfamily-domain-containing protein [Amylostereum chailletii]|nr:thioesterase-like superfamily-domain-containing protein [Amylostereum chailletii]